MKKSVYSLVLMDDVVQAIDVMAYSLGTSRSNLINQILAEHASVITPERRMQNIFEGISKQLNLYQHFQIQPQAAENMYSIRSVLHYKYNPTIKYAISLSLHDNGIDGILKVVSRTQSQMLQEYLSHFFKIWSKFEGDFHYPGWQQEEGAKWQRAFGMSYTNSLEAGINMAEALAQYIRVIDRALQIYFIHQKQQQNMQDKLSEHYKAYLKNTRYKI